MLYSVIIASHISNEKRITYLIETLHSIIKQRLQVTAVSSSSIRLSILLSVSFENASLQTMFENHVLKNHLVCLFREFNEFYCVMRKEKTPQMQHMNLLCAEIEDSMNKPSPISVPDWVLFCDDDDLYTETRVAEFAARVAECAAELAKHGVSEKQLIGLYESNEFGVDHRVQRHEYWCYCVRFRILYDFFQRLAPYPDVIHNKCCDIVWAEYLRRLSPNLLFSCVDKKMYYYRRQNNADSITGEISNIQTRIHKASPPAEDAPGTAFVDYILDWDLYLHENLDFYLHDTYLRTVVGNGFDDILRAEFLADYPYLDFVDVGHVEKLRVFHERLRAICDNLYDVKFA